MTVVGAFCACWCEDRYLGPVLEQLVRVPGPTVVVHNDQPFFWYGDGAAPSGHASKVSDILAEFPTLDVVKMKDHISTETLLRNYATTYLLERGAEVVLWCDSDMLVDLPEFDRLTGTMAAHEPKCWTVAARHYWRDWKTIYSKGNFRMGFPSQAVWNDGSFDRVFEENAAHCDVMVHHPSYALTDTEVHRKVSSWFHAPLAAERRWWEKWRDRTWDLEQQLEPTDVEVPEGLKKRLEKWRCLEGL